MGPSAAQQWAAELAGWAIDPEILAAAPEPPYGFPPSLFAPGQGTVRSPLTEVASAALRPGASLLDVGAGAGAASLDVVPEGGHLHAVDAQPSMLRALQAEARSRGVHLTTYDGVWPDLADTVPVCDVVICAHVLYNVPDLVPFAAALAEHARARVVVELLGAHPWVPLGPLWEHVHGQPRPDGPTADLAVEVLRAAGIEAVVRRWFRPQPDLAGGLWATYVAFTRRRLCLPASRDGEVAALLARQPREPRESVVLWWDA